MTNEEFMRMYSNSLEHGWVSSKDSQKAAEQKRREQEYNKEYYRTHKASPGQSQRDRARENFKIGINTIKDATSNAWKNFNSTLDSMSEEQAKAWKNHQENYNVGRDTLKTGASNAWKSHQENYNRGMDTLTGKNNRSTNSMPQNQLRARESAAITKASKQNRQRVLNTVNNEAGTEKARLTPIGKIKGAVTKGNNFVRSKFDRFKNAYKNATTQKSTNYADGYKFNGNYKSSNGKTQDLYTQSFNPFMAIDAIVSHYKYD